MENINPSFKPQVILYTYALGEYGSSNHREVYRVFVDSQPEFSVTVNIRPYDKDKRFRQAVKTIASKLKSLGVSSLNDISCLNTPSERDSPETHSPLSEFRRASFYALLHNNLFKFK